MSRLIKSSMMVLMGLGCLMLAGLTCLVLIQYLAGGAGLEVLGFTLGVSSKERRTRMLPYLNAQWAAGLIRSEGRTYYVMVATESQVVIHWEEF